MNTIRQCRASAGIRAAVHGPGAKIFVLPYPVPARAGAPPAPQPFLASTAMSLAQCLSILRGALPEQETYVPAHPIIGQSGQTNFLQL